MQQPIRFPLSLVSR